MAGNYDVRQGDTIVSIAFANGLFPDTIWNHPKNAELRKSRGEMNILLPGDKVFIPEIRIREVSEPTNQVYKFRCKNTPVKLRLQILKEGVPRANEAFRLEIGNLKIDGSLDGDGRFEQPIPPDAKHGKLVLGDGSEVLDLEIGSLDPKDEISGVQGRLRHLGLYFGPLDGLRSPEVDHAVQLFQLSRGMEPNGELDPKTVNALKDDYEG